MVVEEEQEKKVMRVYPRAEIAKLVYTSALRVSVSVFYEGYERRNANPSGFSIHVGLGTTCISQSFAIRSLP